MKTNRNSLTLSLTVATLAETTLSAQAEARTPRSAGSTVTRSGPYGNSSTRRVTTGSWATASPNHALSRSNKNGAMP